VRNFEPSPSAVIETLFPEFLPGQNLPGTTYQLERSLGASGRHLVWNAFHGSLSQAVALHFVPNAVLRDDVALKALRQEVARQRRLIHPHIPRVFDLVEGPDWLAISVDRVEGHSLERLLAERSSGRFEPSEIAPLLGQLAKTLEDAHRIQLLHRDLDVSHLFIQPDGHLLVTQFGVSRWIEDALNRSGLAGVDARTIALRSPQQLVEGAAGSLSDDVYSFGSLFHVLLAGGPPFSGKDLGAQIREALPRSLAARRAEQPGPAQPIPEVWEKIAAACLEKNPALRPANMGEVVEWLAQEPRQNGQASLAALLGAGGAGEEQTFAAGAGAGTRSRPSAVSASTDSVREGGSAGKGGSSRPWKASWPWVAAAGAGMLGGIAVCASYFSALGERVRKAAPPVPVEDRGLPVPVPEKSPEPETKTESKPQNMGGAKPSPVLIVRAEELQRMEWDEAALRREKEEALKVFLKEKALWQKVAASPKPVQAAVPVVSGDKKVVPEPATKEPVAAPLRPPETREELVAAIEDTRRAFSERMKLLEGRLHSMQEIRTAQPPRDTVTPAVEPVAAVKESPPSPAQPGEKNSREFVNSLGMKFLPVGKLRFSVWMTRVADFEAFAQATALRTKRWKEPGFSQGPEHPVVNVTWLEAENFCRWLTEKERRAGVLAANQVYRLPTDLEWSQAAGLPLEPGKTPKARDRSVPGIYPWGKTWPPPADAGNYAATDASLSGADRAMDDGFANTSPVGSFAPNAVGLYDMGGNVWQWCDDIWDKEPKVKVLRGSSWESVMMPAGLLASSRARGIFDSATDHYGFRCVLAETKVAKAAPAVPVKTRR
jgi:serine/threonine protein kinase